MITKPSMYCLCGNISENRDTGECASCGAARRKAERMQVKEKKPKEAIEQGYSFSRITNLK